MDQGSAGVGSGGVSGLPPELTAEQLARLAAERPDLWPAIAVHPNGYEDLRRWIEERRIEERRIEEQSRPQLPAPPVAPAAYQERVAPPRAAPRRRGIAVLASVVAGLLVLGGGTGTALALTKTWPFNAEGPLAGVSGGAGNGPAATAAAQEEGPLTFADGIEEKWTVTGSDLGDGASLLGHLPRMMGPINEANRSDQPIQLQSGLLMHYRPTDDGGDVPASWALLDAETGSPVWAEAGWGYPSSCATNERRTEAVCSTSFVSGAKLIGFDEDGIRFNLDSELGAVQYSGDGVRVLSENAVEEFSADGVAGGSRPIDGVSAGTVGNARTPDCVWLYAGGTVSYAGSGCDAPADEVITDAESFNWSVVGGRDPVLLIDEGATLSAFDGVTRDPLWEVDGGLAGSYQDPQVVEREGEDGVLVARADGQNHRYSIIGLRTGAAVDVDHAGDHPVAVVAANEVLVFDGDRAGDGTRNSVSKVTVFDGTSGEELHSGGFPAIENVVEITGGPLGVLLGHPMCNGCSTAEGSHVIDSYTFLGPASNGSGSSGTVPASVNVPESIPYACPADTILLAWAELADGWVLVCGVSVTEPSFVVYRGAGTAEPVFSRGSSSPTSDTARAAVRWDAGLKRYTADLEGGEMFTLDYDIGSMIVRDAEGRKTLEQQRAVRYIFVPLGEQVRTVKESAAEEGAFQVQAPGDSAEDQVRYMLQVLEKAYAGRAMVKEAVPQLRSCSYPAGGYGELIAQMQAIRDNRAELLEALDAMPVDRIPEGQALLDDLYEAIRYSHEANLEYVVWAEQANAKGCAALSASGRAAAEASDPPKERFAARWNRVIAPKYGVRTFDGWYI
jgi:hypothetical protein